MAASGGRHVDNKIAGYSQPSSDHEATKTKSHVIMHVIIYIVSDLMRFAG